MAQKPTLKSEFQKADTNRASLLQRWRDYAALSVADVLPPLNQDANSELPGCWRNIGAEGVENMIGRLLTSLFPIGLPWFQFVISAEVKADQGVSVEQKNALTQEFYRRELVTASRLEASNYRLAQRAALESLMVSGNSLTRQGDDYDLRFYRSDNWVCRRSGTGQLLWIITRERKHPTELPSDVREKAKIKADDDELHDLFTRCKWLGEGQGYQIEQEINDTIVNESHEPISPYNCCTYRLVPGEDYARGFLAGRFPDLKSVNHLWEALIFGLANAAKMVPVVDPSEPGIRPSDLIKANGVPIAGRVVSGVVQGVGFLQTNKGGDFSIALQGAREIETSLGRSMLLETASMPKGERVTATAVMRIAQELDGALGGPFAHIADQMQKPLLERTSYQLERDKVLPPMPAEFTKRALRMDILTGASALSRGMEVDKLMGVIQTLAPIPGALDGLDKNVLVDRIFMYRGIDPSGLIKSAEQLQAEMQQKMMADVMPAAGKEFVSTIGDIVKQRAAQQTTEMQGSGSAVPG